MPYKTVSLKLLRPTGKKKEILDEAIDRYSNAFEFLLRGMEKDPSRLKELMAQINSFQVEPFKDALKVDLTMLLSTHKSRESSSIKTSFPRVRVYDEDIQNVISLIEGQNKKKLDGLFDKYLKERPLYFCRFDKNRDYSILKDIETGRYYIKLYVFNKAGMVQNTIGKARPLQYIPLEDEFLINDRSKKRYILLPVEIGKWQQEHLWEIEEKKAILKSAQLIKKSKDYFLNIKLWYEPVEKLDTPNFMAVVRGIKEELFYAVCDSGGDVLKTGSLSCKGKIGKNQLHDLSNQVLGIALGCTCRIIMTNLITRDDSLKINSSSVYNKKIPLSKGDYNLLVNYVSYKAEAAGLEAVVLSARGIFHSCPSCGTLKYSNRLGLDTFICVSCGFSDDLETVGATNLARKLIHYQDKKIIVSYHRKDNQIYFYLSLLNLRYHCEDNHYALESYLLFLKSYLEASQENPDKKLSKNQISIIRKLSNSENIVSCIELAEKK